MRKLKRFALKRKVLFLRTAAILAPVMLAVLLLSQTVFAKNTYLITDGSRVFTYTTFATDPAVVLGEAGLELGEDDTYTTQSSDGRSEITVQRSQDVTIEYYGQTIHASTSGETVAQLLARLNIVPDGNDVLSHSMDTVTYDGLILRVDKVIRQEQTYASTLPHDTTYCYDPNIPEGTQEVLIEGVDGEVLCTSSVTYINGQETERTVLTENVLSHPITEIIAIGSGDAIEAVDPLGAPIIGDGIIILPTGEVLTYTDSITVRATAYTHTDAGCDFITATGTTVHWGTVAVDPRYIPYGTRMFIMSQDGSFIYGIATAEDCGGAIKGDRVDLYMPTYGECIAFGRQNCIIYFLD